MPYKYWVIFNDKVTSIILNYIRENIYKNYPYKSLSNSSLLSTIRFETVENDIKYLENRGSKLKIPYMVNRKYRVYTEDVFIGETDNLEMQIFDSKSNKEYLKLRSKQIKNFK